MVKHAYLYDNEWAQALARLQLLERTSDPATLRYLEEIGVARGWRCVEVGAGAGSIAAWLSQRVGPEGRVAATDVNTRFLRRFAYANLEVRQHNIVTDGLETGVFDLVHSRCLLIHLPERERVVLKQVSALRPGGWMLFEEPEYSETNGPSEVSKPASRRLFSDVLSKLRSFQKQIGMDLHFPSRIFSLLAASGFQSLSSEVRILTTTGGSTLARYHQLTYQQAGERAVEAGIFDQQLLDRFLALFDDPYFAFETSRKMAVWGQKPELD